MPKDNKLKDTDVTELFRSQVSGKFHTVLADPPWRFMNRMAKGSPENPHNYHYSTLSLPQITSLPVAEFVIEPAHLYLWIPNCLIPEGLHVMNTWGFTYKTNIVWHKICKNGNTDRGGLGNYFRNATELVLFGVKGSGARTLPPGRTQANHISHRKQGHSRKPDELYTIIEQCSRGDYLEMFARRPRLNWQQWGNQLPPEPDVPST
jgi:N6-adenosine-specific RNA methylase IME4